MPTKHTNKYTSPIHTTYHTKKHINPINKNLKQIRHRKPTHKLKNPHNAFKQNIISTNIKPNNTQQYTTKLSIILNRDNNGNLEWKINYIDYLQTMRVNAKIQKEKSKTTIPKTFTNALSNKTINKTKILTYDPTHNTNKVEEKRKKKHHHTPIKTTKITHKTKTIKNAHKSKQQNHQHNTSKPYKTTKHNRQHTLEKTRKNPHNIKRAWPTDLAHINNKNKKT